MSDLFCEVSVGCRDHQALKVSTVAQEGSRVEPSSGWSQPQCLSLVCFQFKWIPCSEYHVPTKDGHLKNLP